MSTYTITFKTPNNRAENIVGTLNDIRAKLIDEAFRWDWNLEGWQDLAEAVEDGTADPATTEEIIALASTVWDMPANHISIEEGDHSPETFTDTQLVMTISHVIDMDESAITDAIDTTIEQIEFADRRTIDRDEITQRDADFIIEAIKSAHRAGDYGEQELAKLEELAQRADDLKDSYTAARDERNQAVRAAIRAGATVADVAAAGHLSKTGVRKLMGQ